MPSHANGNDGEVHLGEDDCNSGNLLNGLILHIEHIEFPPLCEHLLCHLSILEDFWSSIVKFLGGLLIWIFKKVVIANWFILVLAKNYMKNVQAKYCIHDERNDHGEEEESSYQIALLELIE